MQCFIIVTIYFCDLSIIAIFVNLQSLHEIPGFVWQTTCINMDSRPHRYDIGQKLLCFEPDSSKAKLIYFAKVIYLIFHLIS